MNSRALHQISYGLYVVTSCKKSGEINGQICNSVFQVTAEPAQLAIALNKQNYTHEFVSESGIFCANVLNQEADMMFIGHFGFRCGRDIDKFGEVKYSLSSLGNPILEERSNAWLECKVQQTLDVGSHTLFIGLLQDAEIIAKGNVLTYEYYHKELKGKAPKTATTYIPEDKK